MAKSTTLNEFRSALRDLTSALVAGIDLLDPDSLALDDKTWHWNGLRRKVNRAKEAVSDPNRDKWNPISKIEQITFDPETGEEGREEIDPNEAPDVRDAILLLIALKEACAHAVAIASALRLLSPNLARIQGAKVLDAQRQAADSFLDSLRGQEP